MRQYKGTMTTVLQALGVALSLYCLLYASGVLLRFGIHIGDIQNSAILLGAVLVITFLLYPPNKAAPKDRLPWYDGLFALLSFGACAYIVYFYSFPPEAFYTKLALANNFEIALGLILIAAIFEAGRRTAGLAMVVVAFLFLLYFFFARYAPAFLSGRGFDLDRGMVLLYLGADGIWGTAMGVAASVIVIFLIFGQFLHETGAGEFYSKLAFSILGQVRGGPAKAAVIGSGLFGMVSGSTTANVATTGVITIPLMKSVGYRPEFAGAVEAVASNGGQIMPPVMGVVAFVMAEWLGIPYWEVCVRSFVPAFLYYIAEFVQVDLEAARYGLVGFPRNELPRFGPTFKKGWYFLVPPIALIFLLAVLAYSPQTAAIYSLAILIFLSLFRKETRSSPGKLVRALQDGAQAMTTIVPACAVAGVIIASVTLTGLGLKLSGSLVDLAGGNLLMLLMLTAMASFILGMGTVSLVCYIIVVVLVAPALIKMGVPPLAAHLFVFWWGVTSFITPPVALGAYVAAGIAGANPWKTGWLAVRLGIVTFILPFFFVYNPALLLMGSLGDTIAGVACALVATFSLASAVSGYMLKSTSWLERIVLVSAAFALLVDNWKVNIVGVVLAATSLLYQWRIAGEAGRLKAKGAQTMDEASGRQ